jgi:hypothetical protein
MKTLSDVKIVARRLCAVVEDDKVGDTHECRIEAPFGKIWSEGGTHEIVDASYRPWKPDYDCLISRMSHGLDDCPHGDECDWCFPEKESS